MSITLAPCSTAYEIPDAIRCGFTEPPPETRIGMTLQPQQWPAMPTPLLPRAAITLATCVPCPFVSCGSASLSTKSQPGTSASARSGIGFAPVSIVAMTMLGSPVVMSQTSGMRTTL